MGSTEIAIHDLIKSVTDYEKSQFFECSRLSGDEVFDGLWSYGIVKILGSKRLSGVFIRSPGFALIAGTLPGWRI